MLRVRLGEGFQNDTVSIRLNGEQVFRKSGLSTDWTIARADAFEAKTDATTTVRLEVAVEGGPNAVQALEPEKNPFVEVRLVSGVLEFDLFEEEPPAA